MSALVTLYGGQFKIYSQLVKPNDLTYFERTKQVRIACRKWKKRLIFPPYQRHSKLILSHELQSKNYTQNYVSMKSCIYVALT